MQKKLFYVWLIVILLINLTCSEDESGTVPKLITLPITDVTTSSAKSGGSIMSDGGDEIVTRGICWSTSPEPTVANDKTTDGAGPEDFISSMEGLMSNTTYYVRAYASNANGTGYGNSISFTTGIITLPTVNTAIIVTDISIYSAQSGGTITSDGGGNILGSGVCWSTTENPTVADSKTTDVAENGVFVSEITGLNARTDYYVRAYVSNEAGTAYGEVLQFTTRDEYSGQYDVISGEVFRERPDGTADPASSGSYLPGTIMVMDAIFGQDTVRFFPAFLNGDVPGIDATIAIIDRTVTNTDGSHPVKIMSTVNTSLKNIPGTESKFFPGLPSSPGATANQEFLLNFQWQLGGFLYLRTVTNLRLRYKF